MRVLYVSPTGGSSMSGAAPLHFALEAARRGVQVTVFGATAAPELDGNARIHAIGDAWSSFGRRMARLRQAIGEAAPDVVHVFWHPGCELYPALVRATPRPVWLVDGRSPVVHSGLSGHMFRTCARAASFTYDHFVSPATAVGQKLFGTRAVSWVPLGFDDTIFFPGNRTIAREADETAGLLRLVYTGSLNRRRGIGNALIALSESLARTTTALRLKPIIDVYGQGDDEGRIAAITAAIPNCAVRLKGFLPRATLAERLRTYDVGLGLVPARVFHDSPALKTLEFLASGLPVIANDSPGNRMYVEHAHNGWLVDRDPESLAALVLRLCSEGVPTGMTEAAARSVQGHTWTDVVERHLLPLYRSLTPGAGNA